MTRVLIVDDNEENLDYLQDLLSGHGCAVERAHDGAEALAKARLNPPDVVVSDLLMPVMDGYTLLRHWKAEARLRQVPFFVFTATYTDPDDERLALNLGADAFILKPTEPEHLIARLREVRANAAALHPAPPRVSWEDENTRLKLYSETLIRRLEERTLQLATVNRTLQQKLGEREVAEEEIRLLAEAQMAILNALPAHIALVNVEGVIVSVNEAWRRFAMGNILQREDFCVGQNYLKVCEQAVGDCSSEAPAVAAGIRRVLQGEMKEFVIEYPCHSPEEQRWFRLMATPLQEERLAGAVIMHVNITDRKRDESELRRAERAARESETRLGFALEAADVGDWSLDLRTNVAHRSLRHDQCFGYRDAVPEWGYDTFLAHIQPADRERVDACFKRAMAGLGQYDTEFRTTWRDGSVHWLWTKGRFYFDDQGRPCRVAGIVSEITARKGAELALSESEARHRQISAQLAKVLDSSLDVICTFDAAGRFTQVSAACERVWGYRPEELLGTPFIDKVHPEDRASTLAQDTQVMAGQPVTSFENRYVCKDGAVVHILWSAWWSEAEQSNFCVAHDNTAAHHAREALRESHEKFTQLADTVTDVFWVRSPDMQEVHYISPGYEKIWGRPVASLTANPGQWSDFILDEDRERVREKFARLTQDTPQVDVEYRITRPDGELRWVRSRGFQVRDAAGRLIRLTGIASDITQQKQAEAALRASDERFRSFMTHSPAAGWIVDGAGRIRYASPGYYRMFAVSEDMTDRTIGELYEPALAEVYLENNRRVLAEGRVVEVIEPGTRADGSPGEFHVFKFPIEQPGTEPLLGGIAVDITERRQIEERVAEQAALIDQAHDAIIVRDLEHRITFWNRGAERLYGWTALEARGRPLPELLQPATDTFADAHATVLREGSWNGEIQKTTQTGTVLTLDVSWTLLRDAHGKPKSILAIDTNITDRKKLEQQFLRAQRLESIGTLAGGIAHDLNNLLSPITMGVDLLKLYGPNPKSLPVIDSIELSARRGANLVKQVLSFARGVEGARVVVQLQHILKEVESIAQNTFPRNIHVETRFAPEVWSVLADPTQLNQVVLNLAVNARDAMPDGGRLELKAENVELDTHYALMNRGVVAGRYVKIEVIDSGSGIPRAIIERIFEPFFTTKELSKGTGLGLSTVLGIVRSHGGFVNVYSEPGKGSTFKVYLPAQENDGPVAAEDPGRENVPRGRGELVLVVDDEAPIREITKQTLLAFGYRVVTAEDGAHAIGIYALQRAEIAVVITDMMMPVMDGPALIAALRRINPQVRIIGASGLHANASLTRAVGAGVLHFLAKPYSADTLLVQLGKVLSAGGSHMPG